MQPNIYMPLLLVAVHLSCAQQVSPLQTNDTASDSTSNVSNSARTSSQPCCWIYPGQKAVKVQTWYPTVTTQYTATVITTFIKYDNTLVAANSTTRYLPVSEVFTEYGLSTNSAIIPGVPTDLVPPGLLGRDAYAATSVIRGNETFVTFDFTDLVMYAKIQLRMRVLTAYRHSPTPYLFFPLIRVYTYPPSWDGPDSRTVASLTTSYNPSVCGTSLTIKYLTYSSEAWTYVNKTEYLPWRSGFGPDDFFLDDFVSSDDHPPWAFPFVLPLPAPMPDDRIWASLPDAVSASMVANKTLLSLSPWVTNCWTIGAEGQPTVHVQVAQLTTEASVTLTTNAVLAAPASLATTPAVQMTTSTSPVPVAKTSTMQPVPQTNGGQADGTSFPSPDTRPTTTLTSASITQAGGTIDSLDGIAEPKPQLTGGGNTVSDVTKPLELHPISIASDVTVVTFNGVVPSVIGTTPLVLGSFTLKPGDTAVINGETVKLEVPATVIVSGGPAVTHGLGASTTARGYGGSTTTQGLGGAIISGVGGSTAVPYTGAASLSAARSILVAACFVVNLLFLSR